MGCDVVARHEPAQAGTIEIRLARCPGDQEVARYSSSRETLGDDARHARLRRTTPTREPAARLLPQPGRGSSAVDESHDTSRYASSRFGSATWSGNVSSASTRTRTRR